MVHVRHVHAGRMDSDQYLIGLDDRRVDVLELKDIG